MTTRSDVPRWKRIARSWLAMKPWVRVWLVVLNLLFLGALFSLNRDLARWLRGERFVMGSPEAVRAGASLPARPQ